MKYLLFASFLFLALASANALSVPWENVKTIKGAAYTIEAPKQLTTCTLGADGAKYDECTAYFYITNTLAAASVRPTDLTLEWTDHNKLQSATITQTAIKYSNNAAKVARNEQHCSDSTDINGTPTQDCTNSTHYYITTNGLTSWSTAYSFPKSTGLLVAIDFQKPKWTTIDYSVNLEATTLDPTVTACGSLGVPDSLYTLTQNITGDGTCLTVAAPNITIDCQGYWINYSANSTQGFGVLFNNFNGTVKNCIIMQGNFSGPPGSYGVSITGANSNNTHVLNNTMFVTNGSAATQSRMVSISSPSFNDEIAYNHLEAFVAVPNLLFIGTGGEALTIHDNVLTGGISSSVGISLSANDSVVYNNNLTTASGITSSTTNNISVWGNNVTNCSVFGISLNAVTNASVFDNYIVAPGAGVGIRTVTTRCWDLRIYRNNVTTTLSTGTVLEIGVSINGSFIYDNNFTALSGSTGASQYAIELTSSQNNRFWNNTLKTVAHRVLLTQNSTYNNTFENNSFIYAAGAWNVYSTNGARNNTFLNNTSVLFPKNIM